MKTRDQVKAVMSNFCNLRDSRGRVQFTPFIGGYPIPRQIEWIKNEVRAGSTHLFVCVDVNGYVAMADPELQTTNFYTDGRWAEFGDLLRRIWNRGLAPVVFLHSGDRYAGDDYYRGICTWWQQHFASLTEQVLFVNGWETRRKNCGLTAHEFDRCTRIMREGLGPQAIFATHLSPGDACFGSHAPVEDDDPWKDDDEPGNWYRHAGVEFEVLLYYPAMYADDNDRDEFGQPNWWNRAMDTVERFLPQGTPLPALKGVKQRDHNGYIVERDGTAHPDWFGRTRERGRPVLVAAEYVAWGFIRDLVTPERVREVARTLQSFGFTHFGNGHP
jgi:hypothetical protein